MVSHLTQMALLALAVRQSSAAGCTRAALKDLAAAYVRAQEAGQPNLLPLADNAAFSYAENNVPMDVAAGLFSRPLKADFTLSFYDTVQCAAFTELIAATAAHPYVVHTRMLLAADDASKVKAIESVVTDEGDWVFNATSTLLWASQENWGPIAPADRDTRETIRAALDAYLDNWGAPDLPVPHGTPCARLEGGLYTGSRNLTANTCDMGAFPVPLKVGNRRYVIDEEAGVVDVFNDFPWLEASLKDGSTPSSNLVRVERGKIRYIHEMTVCVTPGCGRL